jgi:hypothetical protein
MLSISFPLLNKNIGNRIQTCGMEHHCSTFKLHSLEYVQLMEFESIKSLRQRGILPLNYSCFLNLKKFNYN